MRLRTKLSSGLSTARGPTQERSIYESHTYVFSHLTIYLALANSKALRYCSNCSGDETFFFCCATDQLHMNLGIELNIFSWIWFLQEVPNIAEKKFDFGLFEKNHSILFVTASSMWLKETSIYRDQREKEIAILTRNVHSRVALCKKNFFCDTITSVSSFSCGSRLLNAMLPSVIIWHVAVLTNGCVNEVFLKNDKFCFFFRKRQQMCH